jgi:hypothetical protein
MIEPSISETEAAAYLAELGFAVRPQTLRAWRCREKGPAYFKAKNHLHVRYRKSDLDAFVEASRIVPGERKRRRSSRRAAGSR